MFSICFIVADAIYLWRHDLLAALFQYIAGACFGHLRYDVALQKAHNVQGLVVEYPLKFLLGGSVNKCFLTNVSVKFTKFVVNCNIYLIR